jgi:hypothetical protein
MKVGEEQKTNKSNENRWKIASSKAFFLPPLGSEFSSLKNVFPSFSGKVGRRQKSGRSNQKTD